MQLIWFSTMDQVLLGYYQRTLLILQAKVCKFCLSGGKKLRSVRNHNVIMFNISQANANVCFKHTLPLQFSLTILKGSD